MKRAFLLPLLLAACVSGPTLVLSPQPKADDGCPAAELGDIRSVAILPFAKSVERRSETYTPPAAGRVPDKPVYRYLDDDGAAATAAVESALTGRFKVVERRDLQKVVDEQRLQVTGLVDAREAVTLGKLAGADAVLMGQVDHAYAGYHNKTEGGSWVGTYVPRAELSLRLVEVESGRVAWACRISRSALSYAQRPVVLDMRKVLREPGRYDAAMMGNTVEERIGAVLKSAAGDAVGLLGAGGREAFWASLHGLCGKSFEGRIAAKTGGSGGPDPFEGKRLVMHVRQCSDGEVRVPFHVGEDRSRTWVFTKTASGLRLKHDHRHEDGSPDKATMYGGDSSGPGTAERQSFPADAHSKDMFVRDAIPQAVENVWVVGLVPGKTFSYALTRPGREFRVEFDLTRAVDAPPPPWGSR
jgi:curli biogenesis system outer membrane secretion channel CsgG